MAQLSIHPIKSIVRNTVVLHNTTLGALVVLALFECNGFVAVRFSIKGVFCKENRSNTLRTTRVHRPRPCTRHVHGRLHGPTRPVHGRVHSRVHTHTSTPPLQGRVRAIYTAVYTASTQLYTRAMYTARRRLCKCSCTRVVYTAAYTARSQPVHGSVYGRVRRPSHGHPTRAYVYTAVYTRIRVHRRYKAVYTASTQSCTWQVGLHGRVHRPRRHVTAVGRVHGRNA